MSFNLKLLLTFVVFGICVSFFTMYTFIHVIDEQKFLKKVENAQQLLVSKENRISIFFNRFTNQLQSISSNEIFHKFIEDGSNKESVRGLLQTFIDSESFITQVSYIDNQNTRLISINYSNESDTEQYNNYNVDKNKNPVSGKISISKMGINLDKNSDLNTLEAVAIVSIHLDKGMLEFQISLRKIAEILNDKACRFLLVDQSGNVIIDSAKKLSWSLYLEKDINFQELLGEQDNKFLDRSFKSTTKYIMKKIVVKNEDNARLILVYPNFESIIKKDMFYVYLSIFIGAIILATVLAYIFSRPMIGMTRKIQKLNTRLDKKVEQRTSDLNDSLQTIDKYVIRSVTDLSGIIISVSDAFCAISQYSKEELLGKPHSIVRHPDMKASVFHELWSRIKSGKNWKGIVKNLAKDGTFYWVEVYIEPNFEKGKMVSYTAIRNNITDKVLLEELNISLNEKIKIEVSKSTEQLELIQKEQLKSVKLSSIGALAAGITHEINTPLTYIKGNFELIQYDIEDLPSSEIRDRMIEDSSIISDGLNRISNIVEAMREVSQSSIELKEKVNIYDTLRTALIISNNSAKQVTKIYLNGKISSLDLVKNEFEYFSMIQKQRMEQVWIIIINNALDELVKKENYESRQLDIDIFEENDKIVIEFKDNAGGIPDEILETVFDPFVSTKKSGGMGIGLNIAKKIIDENHGIIIAKNSQVGAVFRIELSSEGKNDRKE